MRGERQAEVQADGDGRQGILQVVAPGHAQHDLAQRLRSGRLACTRLAHVAHHRAAPVEPGTGHVDASVVRAVGLQAVGDHPPRHRRQQLPQPLVVGARDDRAVERHLVGERDERLLQVLEIAVALQVLLVDVGDDGHRRRQLQERAVALVGLDDHELAAAQPRAAAEGAEPPADDRRRIEAAALEHERDHRRGRRLAVGARHRDAVLQAHQLGEHLGARDHGDAAPGGFDDLGIRWGGRPRSRRRRRRRRRGRRRALPRCGRRATRGAR